MATNPASPGLAALRLLLPEESASSGCFCTFCFQAAPHCHCLGMMTGGPYFQDFKTTRPEWPTSPFPSLRSRPLKFSKTSLPSLNVLAFKTLRMNHPVHIIHNIMLSSTGYRTGFYHHFHESYCHFRLSYEATILSAPLLSADVSIYQFLLFGSARWHVGS